MCCNNAYVNKNNELIAPEYNQRVKIQDKPIAKMRRNDNNHSAHDKENDYVQSDNAGGVAAGFMQISDRFGENELLVKHIRSTSSIASRSGVLDIGRIKHLAQIIDKAPELHLQILSSGKLKGQVLRINA